MTLHDAIGRLRTNSWRWDLWHFAKQLGLDPKDPGTFHLFRDFQKAAECLGRFDDRRLEIIFSEPALAEPAGKGV